MKTFTGKLVAVVAIAALSLSAFAAPECTKEPQSKWMPEKEMKAKIEGMGYKINRFLTTGSCYEIYGKNKEGKNIEIYFNPVDGSIVKERVG